MTFTQTIFCQSNMFQVKIARSTNVVIMRNMCLGGKMCIKSTLASKSIAVISHRLDEFVSRHLNPSELHLL